MRTDTASYDRIIAVCGLLFVLLMVLLAIVLLHGEVEALEPIGSSLESAGLSGPVLQGMGGLLGLTTVGLWLVRHQHHRRRIARLEPGAALMSYNDLHIVPGAGIGYLARTRDEFRRLANAPQLDTIGLLNELFSSAYSVGASDIHLLPGRLDVRVQFRVDGVLHDVGTLPARYRPLVVNRIKVLARLSMHITATPQDGAISLSGSELQLRVSTLPTSHGEKVVVRLAVSDETRYSIDDIGFSEETLILFKTLLARNNGVIFLTGPTGSGKTTTMYASMVHIRNSRGDTANLVTLEDPVEVDLRGIAQTQIEPEAGLTFAVGLRSVLRQDPDVIMVGEIRDEETATTAIRAGMTGHLLLTSVHADSSVGVFNRLKQLNVERFQLASAVIAVLNQRLALRNCAKCSKPVALSDFQRKQLDLLGVASEGPFYAGSGCAHCAGKGIDGRVPLIEVLPFNDRIRDLLVSDAANHTMMHAAVESGMKTIGQQALQRALAGQIAVDELIRVLSIG